MENKIQKVQRWLERCLGACKSKSWENALADMECAAAELDTARKELWSVVDGSRAIVRARRRSRTVGASFIAAVFVLMSAIPVVMPEPMRQVVQSMEWEDQKAMLELITRDEKALLVSLRKNLSNANQASQIDRTKYKEEVLLDRPGPISVVSIPAESVEVANLKKRTDGEESIALEDMVQLLEIGQKALRKSEGFMILEERDNN